MARPIYSYELEDPDFAWLLTRYRETHPACCSVEATCLPVVLICGLEGAVVSDQTAPIPQSEAESDPAIRSNK